MSKRQEERRRRRRAFWAEKRSAVRGNLPAIVGVRFDELRAEIQDLPEGVGQQWWRSLDNTLLDLLHQVRQSNPHSQPAPADIPHQPGKEARSWKRA